jgi:hypothetical protein
MATAVMLALASVSLAQAPNYDAFSDSGGNIITEQHHAAATALLHDRESLEAVYSDAAKGHARAQRAWQELEANLSHAGVEVAERSTRPGCLIPVYRELAGSCRPDWSFLDFLAQDREGAARLREVIFSAFAGRARERGLKNQAILATVNGLVSAGVAATVLRGGLAANPFRGKTPQEIDRMLKEKGFEPRGPDPVSGKGGYVDPKTGRSYHIDPGGQYKKGAEEPHVDVNRPPSSDLPKRKYPLGDKVKDDD